MSKATLGVFTTFSDCETDVQMSSFGATRPPHWANSSGTAFKNPWPSAEELSWIDLYRGGSPIAWDSETASGGEDVKVVKPDWGAATLRSNFAPGNGSPGNKSKDTAHVIGTWLGHASAFVELPSSGNNNASPSAASKSSVFLLFDPIFSYRAGPTSYIGPSRIRPSPCTAEELPGCDAVFISHNHYDHLDLPSVTAVVQKFPDTLWFVPLGNKQWMVNAGISKDKIIEKDWWDEYETSIKDTRLKISCAPAQHNSGRVGTDKGASLWAGWVIERFVGKERRGSIYHAGDTGYRRTQKSSDVCPAFKEIGQKFGGFDLSFIPIWRGGSLGLVSFWGMKVNEAAIAHIHHAYPQDAMEIHKDVRSRHTVPVHFGTFVGSEAESKLSIRDFRSACEKSKIARFADPDAGNGKADVLNLGASVVVEV